MRFYKNLCIQIFCFLLFINSWSQSNVPPNLNAIGDQSYCPLSQINIVTSFDIIDPDDTEIESLSIQISTGYVQGEDQLLLTGTHPNVVSSWNSIEGKLSLTGVAGIDVPYSDLIAAVKDVVFQSASANISGDKFFSFTIGDANYLPSTDHYYEYISDPGITWTDAKAAAENRTYFGLQGYLVTITSAEEAQLSGEQAAGTGWIGGSDIETEGVWKWMTGPEAGGTFWFGLADGTTVGTDYPYANWNNILGMEPNNVKGGTEDYAHIVSPNLVPQGLAILGTWNDLPNEGSTGDFFPQGYIVEYGGMPGDPTVNIAASTKITIPTITSVTVGEICGEGSLTIEATVSAGDVIWFDALTGGNQVHTGTTYTTPFLTETTNYYVLASVNGCLEGKRTQVTVRVNSIPTITSVTNITICEDGSETLSASASQGVVNWYDTLTNGTLLATGNSFTTPILTSTTTYYVDATFNGCTTQERTPVTLTVSKPLAPTGSSLQTFCDIENATISNLIVTGTDILWYDSSTGITALNNSGLLTTGTYFATQTVNGCESQSRFAVDVIVYETVQELAPEDIQPLVECDNNIDGDSTNGILTFNLRSQEVLLLNGSSSANFNFSYFLDDAYNNLILNPETFENITLGGQTIYVRISNNAEGSCYIDTAFNIEVNPLPKTIPTLTFKNCDEDGSPDGFTDFNLNETKAIITLEDLTDVNITFHLSKSSAEVGIDEVSASPFNNQTSNIVYARVEYINTSCYSVSTINLDVSTTSFPSGYINDDLQLCDSDNFIDGITEFDLTSVSSTFINEFPTGQNLSVSYYRNQIDAQLEENEITNITNYQNQTPFSEILYVRVESDDNGECFGIGPHLQLTVHPRPEFEVDQSDIFCINSNSLELRTINPKGNYTYEWQDSNGNIISLDATAQISSGDIYTVIATSVFNCESFPVSFEVVESSISDIAINDIAIIDLTNNNTVTIDITDIGVGDYEFSLDNEFGSFQDEVVFEKVYSGDHILYVRDKNGCGTAALPLSVLGFPRFFTPNGDSFNPTWNILGVSSDRFTENSVIYIYDRYGKLIKQITIGSEGWDGTFNGHPLLNSDYWFVAELVNYQGETKILKGHFSLKR